MGKGRDGTVSNSSAKRKHSDIDDSKGKAQLNSTEEPIDIQGEEENGDSQLFSDHQKPTAVSSISGNTFVEGHQKRTEYDAQNSYQLQSDSSSTIASRPNLWVSNSNIPAEAHFDESILPQTREMRQQKAIDGGNNYGQQETETETKGTVDIKPEVGSEEWNRLRKNTHKAIERRRRETINAGIDSLARVVPGSEKNKGGILQRAVQYIHQLKENETANIEKWTLEKLLTDQAISELTRTNERLKADLDRAKREAEAWKRAAEGDTKR